MKHLKLNIEYAYDPPYFLMHTLHPMEFYGIRVWLADMYDDVAHAYERNVLKFQNASRY